MYPVTAKWKEETEQTLRNPSYVRIVFGVTDPDAPRLSRPTDNGHLPYSDIDSVDVGTTAPSTYQTMERNRFVLDGKNPLPREVNPIYQGFVGTEISDDTGVYAIQPFVKVAFDDYVQFPGLTFQFDESMGTIRVVFVSWRKRMVFLFLTRHFLQIRHIGKCPSIFQFATKCSSFG